jgi:hypothetical protein
MGEQVETSPENKADLRKVMSEPKLTNRGYGSLFRYINTRKISTLIAP